MNRHANRIKGGVLTTREVAKICGVAPRTVANWIDAKVLRGYCIPGSKDRRIIIRYLREFMQANDMNIEALDQFLLEAIGQKIIVHNTEGDDDADIKD